MEQALSNAIQEPVEYQIMEEPFEMIPEFSESIHPHTSIQIVDDHFNQSSTGTSSRCT
jgi:hypothetical protein